MIQIHLANPRGFCAGVRHALDLTEQTIRNNHGSGNGIYILHEVVHNETVVRGLTSRGVKIADSPDDVPADGILIFSAHGVSEAVEQSARASHTRVIDATCPLVKQIHHRAEELSGQGYHILLAGKPGHREVEGILGRISGDKTLLADVKQADRFQPVPGVKYAILSQTTFSSSELEKIIDIISAKIPDLKICGNVCRATAERQAAVRQLAKCCDIVLIAGSENSSNTKRLCETASAQGTKAFLIPRAADADNVPLEGVRHIGIASGASAPEELVREIVKCLQARGAVLSANDTE